MKYFSIIILTCFSSIAQDLPVKYYRDFVTSILNDRYEDNARQNFLAVCDDKSMILKIVTYDNSITYPELIRDEKELMESSIGVASTIIKEMYEEKTTNAIYNACDLLVIYFKFYYQGKGDAEYDVEYYFNVEDIPKLKPDKKFISTLIHKSLR